MSVSSPNTVTLSLDSSNITISPTNLGTFQFTMTVKSSLIYEGVAVAVPSKVYNFNVKFKYGATFPTLATGGPSITATAGADNSLTG